MTTCSKTFRSLEGKACGTQRLLLGDAMHHAAPLQHVLTVDANGRPLRVKPLYDFECNGVHGIIVVRDKYDGIAYVVVDV